MIKRALAILICAASPVLLAGCLGIDGDEPKPGQHLLVSVGDSVASGEGNPAPGIIRWQSPSWCHRSATSGQALAAREVIESHADSSLRFLSFACSGATIDRGLLGEFRKGTFHRAEPAQLDRVGQLPPETTVDALLISIGANDVGFQRIVTFCTIKDRCSNNRTFGPAVELAAKQHVPVPTLDAYVTQRIAELGQDYDRMNARIPSEIDPGHVLIVEYFDPTRSPHGRQCPVFDERLISHPEEGLVTTAESQLGSRSRPDPAQRRDPRGRAAKRLDGGRRGGRGVRRARDLRAEARALGADADGVTRACSTTSRGTLHPNEAGHRATAAVIRAKLASVLGLG